MSATALWLLIIFTGYVLMCVILSLRGAVENHTAVDYFIGARRISAPVLMMAVTASAFSGWIFLGHAGLIFRDGFQYAYAGFYAITIALTGLLVFKRQWILSRRFGYVTPGELMADYFQGRSVTWMSLVIGLMFAVPFLAVEFGAAGFVISIMSGSVISQTAATWLVAIFIVLCVTIGGLRGIAYAGAVQALLVIAGVVGVGIIAWRYFGTFDTLRDGLAALASHPNLGKWGTNEAGHSAYFALPGAGSLTAGLGKQAPAHGIWTGLMCLTYLLSMMGIQASPAFSFWAFSARSPRAFAGQQVFLSALVFGFLLLFLSTIQGIGAHLLGANAEVNQAGLAIAQVLPEQLARQPDLLSLFYVDTLAGAAPWLLGLFAICLLAAVQSTGAAHLHAAGAMISRDVAGATGTRSMSASRSINTARVAVVIIVLAALLLQELPGRFLSLLGGIAIASGFQLLPALLAVCWFPWLTRTGVAAGIVAGLVGIVATDATASHMAEAFGIALAWGKWPLGVHSSCWGMALNLIVLIAVSAATQNAVSTSHRMRFHNYLREHASVPVRRQTTLIWVCIIGIVWLIFGVGPGAVIGNTIFGEPAAGTTGWLLGVPSIWAWQLLWWSVGVVLIGLLAYRLELSTMPHRRIDPLVADIVEVLGRRPGQS